MTLLLSQKPYTFLSQNVCHLHVFHTSMTLSEQNSISQKYNLWKLFLILSANLKCKYRQNGCKIYSCSDVRLNLFKCRMSCPECPNLEWNVSARLEHNSGHKREAWPINTQLERSVTYTGIYIQGNIRLCNGPGPVTHVMMIVCQLTKCRNVIFLKVDCMGKLHFLFQSYVRLVHI